LLYEIDATLANHPVELPTAVSRDFSLQVPGPTYLQSLRQPTVTGLASLVGACLLKKAAQHQSVLSAYLVPLYPYLVATILFASTVGPIRRRLMDAVTALADQIKTQQDSLHASMTAIGDSVDRQLDDLQAKIHKALGPIEPILKRISEPSSLVSKLAPNLDIPNPAEIDQEFDEMQGKIGKQIDAITDQVNLDDEIPVVIRSPRAFYWRVVVPLLILGWITQMAWTYTMDHVMNKPAMDMPMVQLVDTNVFHRQLRVSSAKVRIRSRYNDSLVVNETETTIEQAEEDVNAGVESAKDTLNQTVAVAQDGINQTISQAEFGIQDIKSSVNATIQSGKDQLNMLEQNITDYTESIQNQSQILFADNYQRAKKLARHVIYSYLLSILQIGLIYILTSAWFKAWILSILIRRLTTKVHRKLREAGVYDVVEDVLGVKLGRVRDKLVRILSASRKAQGLLDKAGSVGEALSNVIDNMPGNDKAPEENRPSWLGIFGR
jgi:vacuolar-type H+-ATPase subunit H